MRNFEYRFVDKKIILTADEHRSVVEGVAKGKNIHILRNGTLAINMSLIGTVSETGELTPQQEEEAKRLEGEKFQKMLTGGSVGSFKHVSGLAESKNENERLCEKCQHIHYMLPGRKVCIACSRSFSKSEISIGKV